MVDENRGKLQPTIIKPPLRSEKAALHQPADPKAERGVSAPDALQPTTIAGAQRERISVSAQDLRRLSPGADIGVSERALVVLAGVVLERTSERKAILWGHEPQKAYGERVAEILRLSQLPAIPRVQGHVGRVLDILGSFDLAAAADRGGLSQYFRGVNSRIDTLGEIAAARRELDQLTQLLAAALDDLSHLRGLLETSAKAIEELAPEVEAKALAALFLSEHTRASRPALADCYMERAMSLTQTLAQIRGNSAVRDRQLDYPLRMIGAIQNVTLVSMPDFLAGLAAIHSFAAQPPALSPTEARELNFKLQDIVRQLRQ